MLKEIRLKCFCPHSARHCHAHTAARFLNGIVDKMLQKASGTHSVNDNS
jgi:integrase